MASALSAKGLGSEKVKNLSQIFKIESEKLFGISEKFKGLFSKNQEVSLPEISNGWRLKRSVKEL
jgi:hypothetical protein